MIVTCESCNTKFRFDPTRAKRSMAKVRCSRCRHVFSVEVPQDDLFLNADDPEPSLFEDVEPEPFVISRSEPGSSPPPFKSRRSGSSVLSRPLVWVAAVVLVGVGLYLFVSLLGNSPSGSSPSKTASAVADQSQVTVLDSTKAYFLENTHVGQMFVVEGEAINESPKPVSFILLEGKLYASGNRPTQTQKCFSGNTMTREELMRLNITEIQNRMMNREGKNLSNVNIASKKRVPFMLVFHNLPELTSLNDYSIEVISAKTD